ncbi:MAG: 2-dehydropantoate 2-reductase [Anaerolineales bacterium]
MTAIPLPIDKLNILVFGAGAIGGYLGGSLALSGHRVVFLERAHNAAALRAGGLHLQLAEQSHHLPSIEVVTSIEDAIHPSTLTHANPAFDLALFALKSYDTAAALRSLALLADSLPPFLCLQNGVENEAALAAMLGAGRVIAGRVIAGTVTTAVAKDDPGRIRLERLRGVGLAASHPISARVAVAMNAAGLNARLYPDAASMKWSKLLTNLLTNVTCAILDLSPTEVMAHPALFALEMRQLREALALMRAMKLNVVDLPGTPVRALAFGARLPATLARPLMARAVGRGRGGKMPSLHIDLHSGKGRSEVDWLNGAVVRAGKNLGVRTPVNKLLHETMLSLINSGGSENRYLHCPARLVEDFAQQQFSD